MSNDTYPFGLPPFCNAGEPFFREIQKVQLYYADALSFHDAMNGGTPKETDCFMEFFIPNPQDFSRSIKTASDAYNDYLKIDLSFPLLDIKKENRRLLYAHAFRNQYAVMLVSNREKVVFGNQREPMSFEVHDKIRDDGSGKDVLLIKIYGKTLLKPILQNIQARFRVLFFIPRLR